MQRKKYQNSNDEKVYIYSIYLYLINMNKNILSDRIAFYLDANGNPHWKYVGMIDTDGTEFFKDKPSDLDVELETCRVCGKTPIKYNFILRNTVPNPEEGWKYVSVGSECIQFLGQEDMLRIKRDQKILKEKHDKENAKVFSSYIRNHFLPEHPEVWKMEWEYFGHKKNVGGSLKFLSEKCLTEPVHEKTFAKELRKFLKQNGIELPNLREMKEIITIPSYEDFKADNEALARAESAYETFYEQRSGILNDPSLYLNEVNPESAEEVKMVPDGYDLVQYYGISPITHRREVLYETLKNLKTGEEDFSEVIPEWDPVIEVPNATAWNSETESYEPIDLMHIHLSKWIAQNKPKEAHNNALKELNPLIKALRAIAGDDQDHAQVDNGIGFSGVDTDFGHSLASKDFLTEKQIPYAKKMVWKYRKQLKEHFPEIWEEVEAVLGRW